MNFANRLKAARKDRGITQKIVYTQLGVSANCYASYEQGRTEPNIEMLKQICEILNVTSDYLLGLEDENGNKIYNQQASTYNNFGIHNEVV